MLRIVSWVKTCSSRMLHEKIIPYVFTLSDAPMLFRDLLRINKMYQDGLKLEGNVPGFRFSVGRSYLIFTLLWHAVMLPIAIIFHQILAKVDCHLLIIMAVLFTGMFFALYAIFKEYLIDTVAHTILIRGWENHFPYFDYHTHAKEVAHIYSEALDKEIPHKELQLYIFEKLVEGEK
ncbi:MAG: hypothetical protein WA080_00980 [Sulfuricurvum sp.]